MNDVRVKLTELFKQHIGYEDFAKGGNYLDFHDACQEAFPDWDDERIYDETRFLFPEFLIRL